MNAEKIMVINREMTSEELQRMRIGFDEHAIDNGVAIQTADRFSYTAVLEDEFVGCSSGLAYKNHDQYSGWFYLTDLFVEKSYRSQGIGAQLLQKLEAKLVEEGIRQIWTWTAGYEAPGFYQKQGYTIFAEMDNWYSDGSSRVGLRKQLEQKVEEWKKRPKN